MRKASSIITTAFLAQMASIEVSLAGSRRRSAGARDVSRELDALRTALTDKDTLIQRYNIMYEAVVRPHLILLFSII